MGENTVLGLYDKLSHFAIEDLIYEPKTISWIYKTTKMLVKNIRKPMIITKHIGYSCVNREERNSVGTKCFAEHMCTEESKLFFWKVHIVQMSQQFS